MPSNLGHLAPAEGFRRKLEIEWGEAFSGDDHDTVSRTPRTISPHHAEVCSWHLCFDVYKMLRFSLSGC